MEWEPLHLRGMYSHSPWGSASEVSGTRGLCSSFHPFYHSLIAVDQCISQEANITQQAVFLVLCNCSSPCLSCYKCFKCYYLIFPKFYSSLCKQKIPHLDLKSKKASHFQGKGSSLFPPSLALSHSPAPSAECYCSTCVCQG